MTYIRLNEKGTQLFFEVHWHWILQVPITIIPRIFEVLPKFRGVLKCCAHWHVIIEIHCSSKTQSLVGPLLKTFKCSWNLKGSSIKNIILFHLERLNI